MIMTAVVHHITSMYNEDIIIFPWWEYIPIIFQHFVNHLKPTMPQGQFLGTKSTLAGIPLTNTGWKQAVFFKHVDFMSF